MADITRLGEIAMPKLSENMAPEDRRSINNYLIQLRDQMIYMMQNLDETNFSDTMRLRIKGTGQIAVRSIAFSMAESRGNRVAGGEPKR